MLAFGQIGGECRRPARDGQRTRRELVDGAEASDVLGQQCSDLRTRDGERSQNGGVPGVAQRVLEPGTAA